MKKTIKFAELQAVVAEAHSKVKDMKGGKNAD